MNCPHGYHLLPGKSTSGNCLACLRILLDTSDRQVEAAREAHDAEMVAFGEWVARKTHESGGDEPGHCAFALKEFRALSAPAAERELNSIVDGKPAKEK